MGTNYSILHIMSSRDDVIYMMFQTSNANLIIDLKVVWIEKSDLRFWTRSRHILLYEPPVMNQPVAYPIPLKHECVQVVSFLAVQIFTKVLQLHISYLCIPVFLLRFTLLLYGVVFIHIVRFVVFLRRFRLTRRRSLRLVRFIRF